MSALLRYQRKGMDIEMREALRKAVAGSEQEKEAAVLQIKALPRTKEGLFDLSGIDCGFYEACGLVFPLYAAYETNVNKKSGYPDIMAQMRTLETRIETEFTQENAVLYVRMLIDTISVMSPEIYEYYRELADLFKNMVKKIITVFDLEAGKTYSGFERGQDAGIFSAALEQAFRLDILLKEKYEALVKTAV